LTWRAATSQQRLAGSLSELAEADTSEVFADPDAEVFELVYGTTTFGWFAARVRDTERTQVTPSSPAGPDPSTRWPCPWRSAAPA
jgi:hypothetical protein